MRICIIGNAGSPFGYEFAKAFMKRGHEAELFSVADVPPIMDGVRVRGLGAKDFRPGKTRTRLPYLKAIRPIRRAVREYDPDIVMAVYLSSGALFGCLSGHRRVVVTALGSDVFTKVGSRIWRGVLRWVTRRAVLVHTVSVPLAETLIERIDVPEEKIVVAPVGIDTNQLAYVEPSRRPGEGRIISTRGHNPVYDHPTLVEAMLALKARGVPCHLTFASARDVELTEQVVRDRGAGDVVSFLGGYGFDELPSLLAGQDVYVSSSLSDGTSNSLLEALSTGMLPVVSDIPANRPWVEHGRNGLLFPPGDADALADRLEEALANADLRAAAAPINRRIAEERGDSYRLAGGLLAAFERCLAADGSPARRQADVDG